MLAAPRRPRPPPGPPPASSATGGSGWQIGGVRLTRTVVVVALIVLLNVVAIGFVLRHSYRLNRQYAAAIAAVGSAPPAVGPDAEVPAGLALAARTGRVFAPPSATAAQQLTPPPAAAGLHPVGVPMDSVADLKPAAVPARTPAPAAPTPPPAPAAPAVDLVFGVLTGLKDVHPMTVQEPMSIRRIYSFLASFRRFSPATASTGSRVLLFVGANELRDANLQRIAAHLHVTLIQLDTRTFGSPQSSWHPSNWRWILYHRFVRGTLAAAEHAAGDAAAKQHAAQLKATAKQTQDHAFMAGWEVALNGDRLARVFGKALFVDVRDTVFQSDPFAVVDGSTQPGLHVFNEVAGRTIGECFVNARWVKACFGDSELERIAQQTVSCCGVVMATWPAAVVFVQHMVSYLTRPTNPCEYDQGIFNWLVHAADSPFARHDAAVAKRKAAGLPEPPRLYVHSMEHGPVLHGQEARDMALNHFGEALNADGKPWAILHQYDRIGQLLHAFYARYDFVTERTTQQPNYGLRFSANPTLPPISRAGKTDAPSGVTFLP